MAPMISKPDHTGEELRLELEALNQALQYRSYARCKSHSPLLRHTPSPKRPLQPKPSFKVPFRSASFISCDRSKGSASPLSSIKPLRNQSHQKIKGPHQYEKRATHHEKKGTHHEKKGLHHQDQHCERKNFWRWRPLRAISHLIMSSRCRLRIMFSVLVHRIEGLPLPMNGLRLTVRWFCKNQGLQTMPSRIFHGIAEFGETLQHHECTVYGTRCPNNIIRYDAKPSTLSIVALDVDELELAKHHVDLSTFIVQNDVMGNIWQEKGHKHTNFELSGMAKGSTLIVSFSYEVAHHDTVKGNDGMHLHPTTRKCKETSNATNTLPPSKPGLPLIDVSDFPNFPPLSEPGAHCHDDTQQLDLIEGHAPQADLSADNRVLDASDNGFSSSFEFKLPNQDSSLEDKHREDFSFRLQDSVEEAGPASFEKFESSFNQGEGRSKSFPFNNMMHICDNSNFREVQECKIGTQVRSDQSKPQGISDSGQERSGPGQSNLMNVLQTEFDDEVDRIAEEFLNMLGIN